MMFRHAIKRFPLAVEGYRLLTRIIAASRGGKRRAYAVGLISRIQNLREIHVTALLVTMITALSM